MRSCGDYRNNCDGHLHAEIEVLKQALVEKQTQLIAMETACLRESDRHVELEDNVIAWQDKYDRLYDSHKRVQKVNQTLEDKLLKLVDRNSGERAQLTSDVATLSVRLAQANHNIAKLQREIERYKADMNLAIQLLQCKPDGFVSQKVSSLPIDFQSKVSSYMRLETNSHSDSEGSGSGVGVTTSGSYKVLPASDSPPPACPFPPTAMVYSMRGLDASNGNTVDGNSSENIKMNGDQMISPSVMAKFLEDELKANEIKHCDTCQCSTKDLTVLADVQRSYSVATQTPIQGENNTSLCLRCNSNLNSPSRTNSPYVMKLVKSSDSVISETKSSVSDLNDCDKLFTPAKRDDLMVNPILSHHRLCDRTANKFTNLLHQHQQNSFNDTAKYVLDPSTIRTFKDGCDLIDFLKYSEKSPSKLITTSPGHQTRKLQSSSLIKDQSPENIAIPDENRLPESIVKKQDKHSEDTYNCDKQIDELEKCNMRSPFSGSINSLWSKSSSCEGAKIFENFNRNLIKTIKAENPKYRGPRLCAMRIQQNGQSNILLDSMESSSEVSPVIYTRRERFLDEELDDTKDIITSKTSSQRPTDTILPKNSSSLTDKHSNEQLPQICGPHTPLSNCKVSLNCSNNNLNSVLISEPTLLLNPSHNIIPQTQSTPRPDINMNRQLTNNYLEHQFKSLVTAEQHQQLLKASLNYEILQMASTSCKNSLNSKSCTHSSSISDTTDLQESVLLRRQQLNRVAEWVQNNSQLDQHQQVNGHINNYTPTERLSTDSSSKTNVHHPYITSNQTKELLASHVNQSANTNQDCRNMKECNPRQHVNGIQSPPECSLEYKYCKDPDNNPNKPVDIAQMEYNVKQFLLKQNEWSMRSGKDYSTATSSNRSSTPARTPKTPAAPGNKDLGKYRQHQPVRLAPHRTETNL